jgi:hypothetical protein
MEVSGQLHAMAVEEPMETVMNNEEAMNSRADWEHRASD